MPSQNIVADKLFQTRMVDLKKYDMKKGSRDAPKITTVEHAICCKEILGSDQHLHLMFPTLPDGDLLIISLFILPATSYVNMN